jgi:hypothetical protein
MKKIISYITIIASLVVFFSCDPYDNIYEELDANKEDTEGAVVIALGRL